MGMGDGAACRRESGPIWFLPRGGVGSAVALVARCRWQHGVVGSAVPLVVRCCWVRGAVSCAVPLVARCRWLHSGGVALRRAGSPLVHWHDSAVKWSRGGLLEPAASAWNFQHWIIVYCANAGWIQQISVPGITWSPKKQSESPHQIQPVRLKHMHRCMAVLCQVVLHVLKSRF